MITCPWPLIEPSLNGLMPQERPDVSHETCSADRPLSVHSDAFMRENTSQAALTPQKNDP